MSVKSVWLRAVLLSVVLSCSSCSSLQALIDAITSADCDSFLANEISSQLAEECRDLEGYLDAESSSLTSLTQILPVANLGTAKTSFFQMTDDQGDPLAGVTNDNTTVSVSTDDGETFAAIPGATVEKLSEVETTQAAILANVDYSGSILDDDLDDVVSGLNIFLSTLTVGYEAAVMKFSTDVDVIQDFTTDVSLVEAAVNDTSYARESTSLYDAIYDGVTTLSERSQPLRLMILFTDGIDNDSEKTIDEAIAHAQDNSVPVCVIGVTFADTATLQRIADETGCFYVYKQFFTSLDEAFENFANQINDLNVVDLPDSFAETEGVLKVVTDFGGGVTREVTRAF